MRQPRLESYFELPTRHGPPQSRIGFLTIPPSIRRIIYAYAGLVDNTIDLNYSNLLIYPPGQYPDSPHAFRSRCAHLLPPVYRERDETAPTGEEEYWEFREGDLGYNSQGEPRLLVRNTCAGCSDGHGLLFVCKQLSREVVPFVYANNVFTVRQGAPNALKRVKNMGAEGMTALASLTMTLDTEEEDMGSDPPDKELPRLIGNDTPSVEALEEYTEVIEHLRQWVRPQQLALFLICRATEAVILRHTLLPLTKLPVLKQCGLWSFVGYEVSTRVGHDAVCRGFGYTD